MNALVLYHHGSSACAAKVRFALEEKRLAWDGCYVDILKGEQFTPEYLAINPKGVVPVLVDGDFVLPEFTVICEYLEDAYKENPIYPEDGVGRANVRLWTKAVDEELHPACSALTYIVSHRHTILRNGVGNFDEFLKAGGSEGRAARELKWQWIQEGIAAPGAKEKVQLYLSFLQKMEEVLEQSDWLVGNRFSMADIAMAPYLNRLSALAMDRVWKNGNLPAVEGWFNRIQQRSTFQRAIVEWVPESLRNEMYQNGLKSWPEIEKIF